MKSLALTILGLLINIKPKFRTVAARPLRPAPMMRDERIERMKKVMEVA